ncbi:MAG: Ribosomal RNA small subunit methyltransferase I [Microgenomates bacterium OLB22]|nr:MAG: Ribosomal RNA small subunit methyltransferase I [Microgenomates bacterium OLB22]
MLYIIPTPIGSLSELSPQIYELLTNVSYIACEDPRSLQRLLTTLSITSQAKILHIHQKNEFEQLPFLISLLERGEAIALMSDAGLPGLQDPGMLLIHQCAMKGLPYSVIPGPSAITTAVVAAGIHFDSFSFSGYFPRKDGDKARLLAQYSNIKGKHLLVFFESPHRIKHTLGWFNDMYPFAELIVCRELGKLHEHVHRGSVTELQKQDYKGEMTIVLSISSLTQNS